ncbi:MAG TPA: hypothetical protein VIU34_20555 [Steroidobacter sp.]
MTNRIDTARERFARAIFDTWEPAEVEALVRLSRKFADALKNQ